MSETAGRVADATGNWVDRLAPASFRPYLRLARFDRPIGAWLLLLPCWWSASLAAVYAKAPFPSPWHLVLFFVGAFVMRGCGCTWNDIVDRNIDAQVARTRSRPIPSGQVSLTGAVVFLVLQALTGLDRAAAIQRFRNRHRHRLACDRRGLSLLQALHLLAADRARSGVFLGRADGMGGRFRPARSSRLPALCGIDRLGDRLRHHLRASGPRRRRAGRDEIDGTAVRRAHQTVPFGFLCRRGGLDWPCRLELRARAFYLRRDSRSSPRILPGKSGGSTSTMRTTASRCSNPTAMPG